MISYPHIDPIIFQVGPLQVRWYGLMYVLGFSATLLLVKYQIKKFRFKEFDVHFENLNHRDSRINRIFEGTNEINRLVITATLIKSAMKGHLPLLDAVGNVAAKIKSTDPGSENFDTTLAKQDYMVKTAKNILLLTVDTVAKKLMETIQDQQEVIALLADIIIEIFVMESGLIRAKKFMAKKGEEKARLYTAAAGLYIAETMPKIVVWAKQVFAFAEQGDEFAAHIEDIERITRYEPDNTIQLKRVIADSVVKKKRYPY